MQKSFDHLTLLTTIGRKSAYLGFVGYRVVSRSVYADTSGMIHSPPTSSIGRTSRTMSGSNGIAPKIRGTRVSAPGGDGLRSSHLIETPAVIPAYVAKTMVPKRT